MAFQLVNQTNFLGTLTYTDGEDYKWFNRPDTLQTEADGGRTDSNPNVSNKI